MHIYRRGKDGKTNKAVHVNRRHKGSERRPGETKAYPVGRLAKKRNAQDLRMSGSFVGKTPSPKNMSAEEKKKLGKRLADGEGCMISLIFAGMSIGVLGFFANAVVQYLS